MASKSKQTFALFCVSNFLFFVLLVNILLVWCPYTRIPWLIYFAWINGPGRKASRRGTSSTPMRKAKFWNNVVDYFPAELVKTADLDPSHKYIFVTHPHGIVTVSTWVAFDCDATGFDVKFPGIDVRPLTLTINFSIPIFREILLLHGVCDASRQSCLNVLGRGSGSAILLAVGGASESLLAEPGTYDLILRKRKGFVKVALESGAHLVPTLLFGENDLFWTHIPAPGSFSAWMQRAVQKWFGFTMPKFWGEPLLWGNLLRLMPRRVPLNVVVGPAVPVPHVASNDPAFSQLVDEYHKMYMEALQKLWDDHKDKYAPDRMREMRFVA